MKKPVVFDADGLHIIKSDPGMVKGWTNAILTPNHGEFVRLAAAVGVEVDESNPAKSLEEVCTVQNTLPSGIFIGCIAVMRVEYTELDLGVAQKHLQGFKHHSVKDRVFLPVLLSVSREVTR